MTTTLQSIISGAMLRIASLPARPELTEHDFRVCESCGGPALLHPRLEIGTSDSNWRGARKVMCCTCLHNSTKIGRPKLDARFKIGDQIWECGQCATERAWGLHVPPDRELAPALQCAHCQTTTRHLYSRVA